MKKVSPELPKALQTQLAELRCGDLVAFSSFDLLGFFINLGSLGLPFFGVSHVAIVGEYNGRLLLFESTTGAGQPCSILGREVRGTQAQDPDSRIKGYRGKVWHYPLARPLPEGQCKGLSKFLLANLGKPYDEIGAFRSGGKAFSWLESLYRDEDLSSIFCSEFCCAAHRAVGIFKTDHVSKWSPNKYVRTLLRKGILLEPVRLK